MFHDHLWPQRAAKTLQQKEGHDEKADSSYCTSSTVNRCVRGRIRSSRAAYSFAVAKPIGNPTDRLHQCWSALPVGTHLDLHSKRMCVCALRCLLWRSLEIPLTPLALALLGASKSTSPSMIAERQSSGIIGSPAPRLKLAKRNLASVECLALALKGLTPSSYAVGLHCPCRSTPSLKSRVWSPAPKGLYALDMQFGTFGDHTDDCAEGEGPCRRLTTTEVLISFVLTLAIVVLAGARRCDCTTRGGDGTRSPSLSVAAADGFASRSTGPACASAPSCKTCASANLRAHPQDIRPEQNWLLVG
jgi:hypothetical protein